MHALKHFPCSVSLPVRVFPNEVNGSFKCVVTLYFRISCLVYQSFTLCCELFLLCHCVCRPYIVVSMTVSCPPPSAGRGTGVISVAGARPVVPASYVPEDLVAQAQTVLQGKSRNLIIRELQVRVGGWGGGGFSVASVDMLRQHTG